MDEKWTDYREHSMNYSKSKYESLMAETWPLLYKAWEEDDSVVNKDAARLLCMLSPLFELYYGYEGAEGGSDHYLDVLVIFHGCLINALIFKESIHIDDNGNLVVPAFDGKNWIVNPSTFELPDLIPGLDDEEE